MEDRPKQRGSRKPLVQRAWLVRTARARASAHQSDDRTRRLPPYRSRLNPIGFCSVATRVRAALTRRPRKLGLNCLEARKHTYGRFHIESTGFSRAFRAGLKIGPLRRSPLTKVSAAILLIQTDRRASVDSSIADAFQQPRNLRAQGLTMQIAREALDVCANRVGAQLDELFCFASAA